MQVPANIVAAAQASHEKFWPRGPFVSVALAQWALESAWGRRPSGWNNYWGIQANAEQLAAGEFTVCDSFEYIGGRRVPRVERFANYPTLEAGFDAHARLLTSPHYVECQKAQTPEAYCVALHADGYATAPTYSQVLISIITQANLKQYDQRGGAAATEGAGT